ncbi:sulfate transport system permease protein [Roseimicrobium gellanilyticum]|uniref:Sulfate transport system permease protein CysT n=1 Tax=Roseimicrobium gellanilyticum TaxID=748857 RepID=A0A366HNU7_9BACT|nr:sulfate ABC transporter permease subunit CysT [Roseimicrobium gellanilyticum]RBP45167.1 sulfate transport system permease protein [Roseimicrobium gellanilyticum]
MSRHRRHVLPGFKLTLGFTLLYLILIVLIPLSALIWKSSTGGWEAFWKTATDVRVLGSLKLSFGTALAATLVNGFFGVLTAWVLERYRFPGKRLLDAMVDLPFALPTAVAGIALVTLYSVNGLIGKPLSEFDIKVAFTPTGITLALIFVGFPFVVRTVQPVIADLSLEPEEAAACLGATRWQTLTRVILPAILPSTLAGMALSFGRAVGEYGSVVFISGNLPFKTEIAPLLIVTRLEQYDYAGATTIGLLMLFASFLILVISNRFINWHERRTAQ